MTLTKDDLKEIRRIVSEETHDAILDLLRTFKEIAHKEVEKIKELEKGEVK